MKRRMRGACLVTIVLALTVLTVHRDTSAQAPPSGRRYRIIDLGTLGGVFSKAHAINDKGQVVGESLTSANLDTHPFVWTGGVMRDIPGLSGTANAFGRIDGINDDGSAVGTWDSGAAGDIGQLFVYDLPTGALSFPLGQGSFGLDINDAGQILAGRVQPSTGFFGRVILSGAAVIDLDALFGAPFQGEEINAFGYVVGPAGGPSAVPNSFIYRNGSFDSIFGSVGFLGVALNDANDAAGVVREQTPFFGVRSRAAMRGANGAYQIFGSFNVSGDSSAVAINNRSQIVGTERASGARIPFLIENGTMRNLNSLLPAGSGWQLLEANDINDLGEIVGSGRIDGEEHAFLLTPLTCSQAEDSDGDGNPDNDGDSLCDAWETEGVDGDGDGTIDLVLTGADLNRRDLFVEVDYMASADHSHRPDDQALARVTGAFADDAFVVNPDLSFGVTVHLGVDEPVPEIEAVLFRTEGPDPLDDFNDIKRGHPADPCALGFFGTALDRAQPNCEAILEARRMVFRYAIVGHALHDSLASGIAEIGGNDFMVTLGTWDADMFVANGGSADPVEARIEVEAGTFMHEFGHTLGLSHGGGDGINCKPNYLSVMNYTFQFRDVVSDRPLNYSFPRLPTLNESDLDEMAGIGGPGGRDTAFGGPGGVIVLAPADGGIDWNMDTQASTGVAQDISYMPDSTCSARATTFLTGFDDWSGLQYSFRHSPDYADGSTRGTVEREEEKTGAQGLAAARTVDFDGDGVTNFPDNCPAIANPGQQDGDGDGVGDACEAGPPAGDVIPPVLTLPSGIVAGATGPSGAVVAFTASATDTVDGAVPVVCVPQSGATFALGTTRVTCTAADAAGNVAAGFFDVTVEASQSPRIVAAIAATGRDAAGNFFVDLTLTNTATGPARNVTVADFKFRTAAGTASVTYDAVLSGAVPRPLGTLDGGAAATLRVFLNVPATVTRFTMTEMISLNDVSGAMLKLSAAQTIVP